MSHARSLDQAIARVETQLRFIPTATLRQLRILALVTEQTGADRTILQLTDDLGRTLGAMVWPLPSPQMLKTMVQVGPAFVTLGLCAEIWEQVWDLTPGVAFCVPDAIHVNSAIYRFVYGPMGSHHIVGCAYPARSTGAQVIVGPVRGNSRPAFAARDLRALEKICARFSTDLSAAYPLGELSPRHAVAEEHATGLDAELRPTAASIHLQAMLALFYGDLRADVQGRALLPAALESDIRRYRDDFLRSVQRTAGEFYHAFTRNRRGRVLCLAVQSRPNGTYRLELHEDQSQHARLRRMMAACRALPRDRTSVFSTCLVVAEGVDDLGEIARRAGFPHLAPSAAIRIVNRARHIVAASRQD